MLIRSINYGAFFHAGGCIMADMFNELSYVYEVYKEKSFSKAAEKIYISQPALSAMIKKVENKVGLPLFDRSTNPIRLTECGEQYIKAAEQIMGLEEEFANYVGNLQELSTGRLAIGAPFFFSSFILPKYISQFQSRYPKVQVSLFEGHSSLIEEKLFAGDLDIVMDNYMLDEKTFIKEPVMEEHLMLMVPRSFASTANVREFELNAEDVRNDRHLSPECPPVPLKNFAGDPFVVLRSHNDLRKRADGIFANAGIKPNYLLKLNQQLTAFHLAETGMGATFVSDTLLKNVHAMAEEMCIYKIGDPLATRNNYLYYRKSRYITPSMKKFLEIVIPS